MKSPTGCHFPNHQRRNLEHVLGLDEGNGASTPIKANYEMVPDETPDW